MDKGQGTCLRANNLYSYMELNRNVDRILPSIAPNVDHKVHPSSKIHEKSQVKINVTILSARHFESSMTISNYSINQFLQFGAECIIGEESIISEKTTIKDCIIGSHCLVEPKVRLTNCILMDKVTIKSGTNIQGSLLCDNATVDEKCDIKNCIIGCGVRIEPEGKQNFTRL